MVGGQSARPTKPAPYESFRNGFVMRTRAQPAQASSASTMAAATDAVVFTAGYLLGLGPGGRLGSTRTSTRTVPTASATSGRVTSTAPALVTSDPTSTDSLVPQERGTVSPPAAVRPPSLGVAISFRRRSGVTQERLSMSR